MKAKLKQSRCPKCEGRGWVSVPVEVDYCDHLPPKRLGYTQEQCPSCYGGGVVWLPPEDVA